MKVKSGCGTHCFCFLHEQHNSTCITQNTNSNVYGIAFGLAIKHNRKVI